MVGMTQMPRLLALRQWTAQQFWPQCPSCFEGKWHFTVFYHATQCTKTLYQRNLQIRCLTVFTSTLMDRHLFIFLLNTHQMSHFSGQQLLPVGCRQLGRLHRPPGDFQIGEFHLKVSLRKSKYLFVSYSIFCFLSGTVSVNVQRSSFFASKCWYRFPAGQQAESHPQGPSHVHCCVHASYEVSGSGFLDGKGCFRWISDEYQMNIQR